MTRRTRKSVSYHTCLTREQYEALEQAKRDAEAMRAWFAAGNTTPFVAEG